MKKSVASVVHLAAFLLLTGCTTAPEPDTTETDRQSTSAVQPAHQFYLPEPLSSDQNAQVDVARISEILANQTLEDEQRAVLLYRRGLTYDTLGLRTLAALDMNQALDLRPNLADAYHYLGVYHNENGDYDRAYESFDSVIELDPSHEFVYLNRGLTSYYNGQYELAFSDIADYYFQDPQDPFRVLWYYFTQYQLDPGRAYEQLHENRESIPEDLWGREIVDFMAGELGPDGLIEAAFARAEDQYELNHLLCEVYFYLGKRAAQEGQAYAAMNYFKLALITNVQAYLEFRYARHELSLIREQIREQRE